jgi:uncharacterized membrane protein YczE
MTATGNPVPIPLRHHLARRLIQLYVGLICYGISCALMIEARLGLDPWDVFHQGVARRIGLSIGTVVIIVGVAVLLLWIPLRQRPGIGTISNAIVIGLAVNWGVDLLPTPEAPLLRWGFLLGGIVLNGIATGLYIGARLGPGPRDGLMTGYVARRPGRSIRLVRTVIEVTVLAIGWLLGGTVGWATLLYAVSIGPLAHVFIPLFSVRGPAPAPAAAPARTAPPRILATLTSNAMSESPRSQRTG